MTRALLCLTGLALLAPVGLGAQKAAVRVTRLGAARSYGPGILQATYAELRFELTRDAHVIVLQVDPSGGITPVFPADSEPGLRPSGVHILAGANPVVPAAEEARITDPVLRSAAELARAGRAVRPPAVAMDDTASIVAYWLVIVSDVPTSGWEVRAQLVSMPLNYRSVEDELRALPAALVGQRAKGWGDRKSVV